MFFPDWPPTCQFSIGVVLKMLRQPFLGRVTTHCSNLLPHQAAALIALLALVQRFVALLLNNNNTILGRMPCVVKCKHSQVLPQNDKGFSGIIDLAACPFVSFRWNNSPLVHHGRVVDRAVKCGYETSICVDPLDTVIGTVICSYRRLHILLKRI